MRWAFWRRGRRQRAADEPVEATSCWTLPATDDPEADPEADLEATAVPPSAFSGAQPAAPADLVPGAPLDPLEQELPAALAAPARAAVVELVRAAAARDADAATALLERLGDAELGLSSVAALAALGPRLATLADHTHEVVPPGSAAWRETVLQGDVTADRAEPLRRAVAGHLPADLLRFVVRFACGTPESDPVLARHTSAPSADLLLAAAVVLAQTAQDGAGPVDALATELAGLLPDS